MAVGFKSHFAYICSILYLSQLLFFCCISMFLLKNHSSMPSDFLPRKSPCTLDDLGVCCVLPLNELLRNTVEKICIIEISIWFRIIWLHCTVLQEVVTSKLLRFSWLEELLSFQRQRMVSLHCICPFRVIM